MKHFIYTQENISTIPTGAPTILVNEQLDTPPVVALKAINTWSIQSKTATYFLNFLIDSFLIN